MVTFVGTNKSLFSVPLEGMDATVDGSYKDGLILKRDGQGGTSLSGTGHAAATVKTYAVTGSPAAAYGLVLAAPTGATNNYALYTTGAISLGTISAGTWNGTVIGATYGGTGINNGSNTITVGGNISTANAFTTSGNFALTLTSTNTTSVTLPTTGTLATLAGTESLTGKTVNGLTITTTTGTLTVVSGGSLVTAGANSITLTSTAATSVTLPTSGTLATLAGTESLTGKTVNGLTITSTTGTLTLANSSSLVTAGAYSTTLTSTAATSVTLPTSGTLATLAGTESLTNKTVNGLTISSTNGTLTLANGSSIVTSGGNSITFVSTGTTSVTLPTSGTLATQAYVDAVKVGLDVKDSVRVTTTANIASLSSTMTIDGVTVVAGDRVLVKDQTATADNGIYVVVSGGAWTRATDFDNSQEVTPGAFAFVEEGTVSADTGWVLTTNGAITVGTTGLSFTQFSGAGSILAGTGLTKTGNTLAIDSTVATLAGGQALTNKSINGLTVTSTSGGTLTLANSSSLVTVGANSITLTSTGATGVTLPTSGTLATLTGTESLTNKTVNGLTVTSTTGTLTIVSGGSLVTAGANSITLTSTAATSVTLPTSGTLATLAGTESLTNKTVNGLTVTTGGTATLNIANGGSLVTNGAYSITFVSTGTTSVSLPTSGTLLSDASGLSFVAGSQTSALAYPAATANYHRLGYYMLYAQTTGNAQTTLTTDGGSATTSNIIKLPQSTKGATWWVTVKVSAYDCTNNIGAAWQISGIFRKNKSAGGTILVGDPMVLASAEAGLTTCSVSIAADTANDGIDLKVTGLISTTINWTASVETTESGSN